MEHNIPTYSTLNVTEEEGVLYDRQIRLWGLDTQTRLRNSSVLVCGVTGLSCELIKNIVLSGLAKVSIADDDIVKPEDLSANFFLHESHIGEMKSKSILSEVQELNSSVFVEMVEGKINDLLEWNEGEGKKEKDIISFFSQYQIICSSTQNYKLINKLNNLCRRLKIYFYHSQTFGFHSYYFCDLNTYKYYLPPPNENNKRGSGNVWMNEIKSSNLESILQIAWNDPSHKNTSKLFFAVHLLHLYNLKYERYPDALSPNWSTDLSNILELRQQKLNEFQLNENFLTEELVKKIASSCLCELSGVCALTGGFIAQEIVKVISGKDLPLQNLWFYDSFASTALLETILSTTTPTTPTTTTLSVNNNLSTL